MKITYSSTKWVTQPDSGNKIKVQIRKEMDLIRKYLLGRDLIRLII